MTDHAYQQAQQLANGSDPIEVENFMQRVRVDEAMGCWIWTGARQGSKHNYGKMYVRGGKGRYEKAHRVSYRLHYGLIPAGMVVCHRCDNPPCVNPSHLWLGTPAENNADRARKGRSAVAERNGRAVLTAETVAEIRAVEGFTQKEIAALYGVSKSLVNHLRNGRGWKQAA